MSWAMWQGSPDRTGTCLQRWCGAMAGCPGVTSNGAKIPRGHGHRSSEPFWAYRAIPCMPPSPWIDAMQDARGAAHLGKLRSVLPDHSDRCRVANSQGELAEFPDP